MFGEPAMDDRLRLLLLAALLFAAIPIWIVLMQKLDSRSERTRAAAKRDSQPVAEPKPAPRSAAAPAPEPRPSPAPQPAPAARSSPVPKIDSSDDAWTVAFAPGSFDLDGPAEAALTKVAKRLAERPPLSIVLDGAYDPNEMADPKTGRALARARVKTVQDALENAGVTSTYLPRVVPRDTTVRIETPARAA